MDNPKEISKMHEYYFKIKKGTLEFEFSTSDKEAFETQLSDWIGGITGSHSPVQNQPINETKLERKGFIQIKELVKINELQSPTPKVEPEFEKVLEDSLENPKIEVEEKVEITSPFQAYLSVFETENLIDLLMLTAKYIWENENTEKFTIKQINAKLVPAKGIAINHFTMQEAIEKGLIKVVPNYTNVADITEYTLTEDGERYNVQN